MDKAQGRRGTGSFGNLLSLGRHPEAEGRDAPEPKKNWPTDPAQYELEDEAGTGVSSRVWRALCKPLGEVVAVKTVDLEGLNRDMEEVQRETHAMRMAAHPNVLRLHTSFVVRDKLWMVTPFMSGGSVYSIIKWAHPDGLEEAVITKIAQAVLRGLAYLHKNGNIHRDVKAGNILVDGNGEVKLGDLGVAADVDRSGSWGKDGHCRQTFVGTPCWMAPEVMQQSAKGYDWHADIWSFGITLLELAHGHAPFARLPPMKVLLMTLTEEPPVLEENYKQRHFSKAMREVVSMCLQKDPEKRPKASKLLEHRFFKGAPHDPEFLCKRLLRALPPLCDRIAAMKSDRTFQEKRSKEETSESEYIRGVSAWHFDINHSSYVQPEPSRPSSPPLPPRSGGTPGEHRDGLTRRSSTDLPGGAAGGGEPQHPQQPKRQPSMKGRFAVHEGSDDEGAGGGSRRGNGERHHERKFTPPEPLVAMAKSHSAAGLHDQGPRTPRDLDREFSHSFHELARQTSLGGKKTERKGRFVVDVGDSHVRRRSMPGSPNPKVEALIPQLQNALVQASQQQDYLQKVLAQLATTELDLGKAHSDLLEISVGGQKGGLSHSKSLGKGKKQITVEVTQRSDEGLHGEKGEPSVASKVAEHPTLKAVLDLEGRVRALAEENERLKRRNVQLEREMNRLQNLRLEAEEAREEHDEEARESQQEKEAADRLQATERAHKLDASKKMASLGNLEGQPQGDKPAGRQSLSHPPSMKSLEPQAQ